MRATDKADEVLKCCRAMNRRYREIAAASEGSSSLISISACRRALRKLRAETATLMNSARASDSPAMIDRVVAMGERFQRRDRLIAEKLHTLARGKLTPAVAKSLVSKARMAADMVVCESQSTKMIACKEGREIAVAAQITFTKPFTSGGRPMPQCSMWIRSDGRFYFSLGSSLPESARWLSPKKGFRQEVTSCLEANYILFNHPLTLEGKSE